MSEPNQDACGCDNAHKPAFTSRRQFLSRFGMGLGGFALAEMLARESAGSSADRGVLGAAALSGEGQAHHLPVHVRRAVAA